MFEVIVVDSTSNDGSQAFYKSFNPSFNFRYHIQENKGKAAARNKGVQLAKGDYIIITDGDIIPDQDFIKSHLDAQLKTSQPTCFEGLAHNMDKLNGLLHRQDYLPRWEKIRNQVQN